MCRATVVKVTLASSTFIKASSLFLRVETALAIGAYYLRQRSIAHQIHSPFILPARTPRFAALPFFLLTPFIK
ncbi:hypothetical protein HK12_12130 [Acetobacter orientalis]|uniref:Uncharacterized protein n=1 Tax=Acetobacter orientalis TaxID=146474 RepID=A0A251ZYM2_9PROT|nr:hypothetical protein HK12_12130 [Acetobacter orientalis]